MWCSVSNLLCSTATTTRYNEQQRQQRGIVAYTSNDTLQRQPATSNQQPYTKGSATMATRRRSTIDSTAFILSYSIIGEKYKSNSFEIIQKKTDVCSNDLIKKLSNKLKRYGITTKNYYINISCSEYEYTDYVINASIKNEYIPLYCYSATIPAKYTISANVRAYTINHALSTIVDPTSNYKNIRDVINHKHYDYYEVLEYKNNA